jgi:hypothetical protein
VASPASVILVLGREVPEHGGDAHSGTPVDVLVGFARAFGRLDGLATALAAAPA